MQVRFTAIAALLAVLLLAAFCNAQPRRRFGPRVIGPPRRRRSRNGKVRGRRRGERKLPNPVAGCESPFRSLDGTCTTETAVETGGSLRPQFAYGTPRNAATPTGGAPSSLPSARLVSNVVCAQAGDVLSRRGLSEMTTFMGQFLDHSIIATPVSAGARFDIPIPPSDPVFANFSGGVFRFERSVRSRDVAGRERPINELSSAIDLTSVYGADEDRLRALRTGSGGLMRTSAGDLLPLNTGGLENAVSKGPDFFVAGDVRANENPVLTSLHTLFLREHNRIARELGAEFLEWSDDEIFEHAKIVNTAQYQKIIYDEYYPAMTGRFLPRYSGYKRGVDPTVSDVFGGTAFRVGHTMVGNEMSRRGPGNIPLSPIAFRDMFFQRKVVMNQGVDPFLRGAMATRSQEVDVFVVNALRNFLFSNVKAEIGFDLMAVNIQRGRDHALPTYNELRVLFGRPPARRYGQITRNRAVQTALSSAYGSIDKIDGIVGLFAEDHAPRASMGRTMLRIWRREFIRLRNGDRFFYLRDVAYPPTLWRRYKPLKRLKFERNTFKEIILRNTNIRRNEMPGSVWNAR